MLVKPAPAAASSQHKTQRIVAWRSPPHRHPPSWALAHELGHALGLWHVEPGTGFVMEAMNPRAPRMMPAKERELAQLAYDVGPGARYPGLEGATDVPALPAAGALLLGLLLIVMLTVRKEKLHVAR